MSEWIVLEQILHIRKVRNCFLCRRMFPIGSSMFIWKGTFDGSFFDSRICVTCKEILDYHLDDDEGYSQGDVIEYMDQYGASSPEDLLSIISGKEMEIPE